MTNNKFDLQLNQKIYIEETEAFVRNKERSIVEATIVFMNKTSGYFVKNWVAERYIYPKDPNPDWTKYKGGFLHRFNLRSLNVQNGLSGTRYKIWFSKDGFEKSLQRQKENDRIRKESQEKFEKLNIKQLQQFLGDENYGG